MRNAGREKKSVVAMGSRYHSESIAVNLQFSAFKVFHVSMQLRQPARTGWWEQFKHGFSCNWNCHLLPMWRERKTVAETERPQRFSTGTEQIAVDCG
jgi:hypothetical protein